MSIGLMKYYLFSVISITAISLATVALADKKPKGAKPTNPQQIVNLYSEKTSHWNSGGFAYWGPGGEYQGLSKTGEAVGIGKWYVTNRGKLCHESEWFWDEGGQVKSDDGKWCWNFVTAPDGQVWERWQDDKKNWYRHKPEKQHNGNTQKMKINALRAKLGV